MPLACIFDTNYHITLLLRTLLPLLTLVVIFGVRWWAGCKKRSVDVTPGTNQNTDAPLFYDWVAEGCVTVAFFLLFLVYPSTSQNILYAFQCLKLDDGRQLLRIDLTIDCNSDYHWFFWVYAIVMVFVYPLGTPVLYGAIMARHKDQLQELKKLEQSLDVNKQQQEEQASELTWKVTRVTRKADGSRWKGGIRGVQKLDEEGKHLKELFDKKEKQIPDYLRKLVGGFEFRVYWFEIAECFRKLMLVGAPVFFDPPGSVQQLLYGLMVSFLIFGLYSYWKPYVSRDDDILAALCQVQIFFALLASVVNSIDQATLRNNYNMGVLLIIFTALPATIAVFTESPLPALVKESGLMESCMNHKHAYSKGRNVIVKI